MDRTRVGLLVCAAWLALGSTAAAQSAQARGTLTADETVVSLDTTGMGTASITVAGTFDGTITFEVVGGPGTAAVAVDCFTPSDASTAINTTTAAGTWTCTVAALTQVQARMSTYTSGTATVFINASPGGGGGGSATIGGEVTVGDVGITSIAAGNNNIGDVDVASSALPTGAATAAKQPALGTAGTASADVITVQGVASMTPISANVFFGGTAAATNEGANSAQVQRFTLATDDPAAVDLASIVTNTEAAASSLSTIQSALSADAVHANTVIATGPQQIIEYNSAPVAVTTGQSARQQGSAKGEAYTVIRDAAANGRGANVDASNQLLVALAATTVGGATAPIEDVAETADAKGFYPLAVMRSAPASSTITSGDNATFNTNASGALWVSAIDPCSSEAKTTTAISLTTDTVIIAAVASKKNYICSLTVVAGAAEIVSITEGTGSVCASSEAALLGSTTDANGASFAANGGMALNGGGSTAIAGITANVDTCLNVSGSNRVSGFVTWVQR